MSPDVHRGLPPREMLPKDEQKSNFSALHGLIMRGTHTTSILPSRLPLIRAFQNASTSPVNFSQLEQLSTFGNENTGYLYFSKPYTSGIPSRVLDRHEGLDWGTSIAAVDIDERHGNILYIRRHIKDGSKFSPFIFGADSPVGLYMAQLSDAAEIAYFAVRKHPDNNRELQIIEDLPDPLKIAMMHDVKEALVVMLAQEDTLF